MTLKSQRLCWAGVVHHLRDSDVKVTLICAVVVFVSLLCASDVQVAFVLVWRCRPRG